MKICMMCVKWKKQRFHENICGSFCQSQVYSHRHIFLYTYFLCTHTDTYFYTLIFCVQTLQETQWTCLWWPFTFVFMYDGYRYILLYTACTHTLFLHAYASYVQSLCKRLDRHVCGSLASHKCFHVTQTNIFLRLFYVYTPCKRLNGNVCGGLANSVDDALDTL